MELASESPLHPGGPVADAVERRLRAAPFVAGSLALSCVGVLLVLFVVAPAVPAAPAVRFRLRGRRRPDLWGPAVLAAVVAVLLLGVLPVVLTAKPVPELNSTGYPLTLPLRTTGAEPKLKATLRLTTETVERSARRANRWWNPRPQAKAAIPLSQIHDATPADHPTTHPLLTLPDGATLDTTPGPVVRITTTGQVVTLPVPDALLCADLIQRRRQYVSWAVTWTR